MSDTLTRKGEQLHMGKVTEQQILSMAPNSSAVANARKISAGGGFVSLSKTEDETFYMGECKGSGKSCYMVSADFIEGGTPLLRCSCPSRQYPCKHGLALLFEMEKGKAFSICQLPDTIREKREKKERRAAKSEEKKQKQDSTAPAKGKKAGKAARVKKMKKQLEGIAVLKKLTDSLLNFGIGTLEGTSLKSYRDLAKQLGDYYLPGPQILLNRLILESEAYQKDRDPSHQEQIIKILVHINALIKKAEEYLRNKVEMDNGEDDDSILYEELGGIWNLERLNQLGRSREPAKLVQLAFEVYFDDARKELIDQGYYIDCGSGEIFTSLNYRPIKALKYVRQEDSVFDVLKIPLLTIYPGTINPRVRWEQAEFEPLTPNILQEIRSLADSELLPLIKKVKNVIKNPLDAKEAAVIAAYKKIGRIEDTGAKENLVSYVLEDKTGSRIILRDQKNREGTVKMLNKLWDAGLLSNQVLFGMMFYDPADHQICMQPFSIVTEQAIVRLAY